jgi:hypothetical protein
MPALRPALLPCALVLAAATALAACDFAGGDGVSGRWSGAAEFEADTLLPEYNLRIQAEYETTFTFRLTDDEGLVTGQVEARTTGYRIVHEAGRPADTLRFDDTAPVVNDVFGTFVDPTLEVDVPDGPYEDDLWTFEVTGRSAALDNALLHIHTILLSDGGTFEYELSSKEAFEMRRVAEEEN